MRIQTILSLVILCFGLSVGFYLLPREKWNQLLGLGAGIAKSQSIKDCFDCLTCTFQTPHGTFELQFDAIDESVEPARIVWDQGQKVLDLFPEGSSSQQTLVFRTLDDNDLKVSAHLETLPKEGFPFVFLQFENEGAPVVEHAGAPKQALDDAFAPSNCSEELVVMMRHERR